MAHFYFNRQKASQLYSDWFVLSKKDANTKYNKEQIDSLRNYLLSELDGLIKHYCEQIQSMHNKVMTKG